MRAVIREQAANNKHLARAGQPFLLVFNARRQRNQLYLNAVKVACFQKVEAIC